MNRAWPVSRVGWFSGLVLAARLEPVQGGVNLLRLRFLEGGADDLRTGAPEVVVNMDEIVGWVRRGAVVVAGANWGGRRFRTLLG